MWYKLTLILILSCQILTAQTKQPNYKNPNLSADERTNDLLSRMTLDEKLGQVLCFMGWEMYEIKGAEVVPSEQFKSLQDNKPAGMLWATYRADPWTKKTLENGLTPELAAKAGNALQKFVIENTRLGIPVFLAEEGAHGHMAIGTTVFPTSLGQAATFNPELIEEMGKVIGAETRAQGAHIVYGPILDLARDPRWSRVEETYGEDPVLVSEMGKAMVKGLGGGDLKNATSAISTLKHFVAYGVPESGQNGNPSIVGRRDLFENFLTPFKDAVDAGALSIMTSYNSIDGVPSTMNKEYLTDILRNDWKFRGFTVSDLFSIEGIKSSHFITKTNQEAAIKAIAAGTNIDLGGQAFALLKEAVNDGRLAESVVDNAVANVLRIKFEMGLFDQPYVDPNKAKQEVHQQANIEVARKMAQQLVVLLENKKQVLPLAKKGIRVAVIGPNADNQYNQLGDYTAPQREESIITVLEGISAKIGKENVVYEKGCAIRDTTQTNIAAAVKAAQSADVTVVVVGGSSARDFKTSYQATGAATASKESVSDMESGEGFDRMSLDLMGDQLKLLKALRKTGKPLVVVYIEGRPLDMNWASENADALLTAWYPGEQGGNGIADVLFGDYNPSGRLPISVPRSAGQIPCYYNKQNPKNHDYVEGDSAPLYAFGYGKSYSAFDYSNLKITKTGDFDFNISFDITNNGNYDGTEVPQLYLRDEFASVVRPQKQLKEFDQVYLKKGETKTVNFMAGKDLFSLIGIDYKRVVEAGTFKVMVGTSSNDIRLTGNIELEKSFNY